LLLLLMLVLLVLLLFLWLLLFLGGCLLLLLLLLLLLPPQSIQLGLLVWPVRMESLLLLEVLSGQIVAKLLPPMDLKMMPQQLAGVMLMPPLQKKLSLLALILMMMERAGWTIPVAPQSRQSRFGKRAGSCCWLSGCCEQQSCCRNPCHCQRRDLFGLRQTALALGVWPDWTRGNF